MNEDFGSDFLQLVRELDESQNGKVSLIRDEDNPVFQGLVELGSPARAIDYVSSRPELEAAVTGVMAEYIQSNPLFMLMPEETLLSVANLLHKVVSAILVAQDLEAEGKLTVGESKRVRTNLFN